MPGTEAKTRVDPQALKPASLTQAYPDGYNELGRILNLAFVQASKGKGHERHAFSPVGIRAWEEQASMQIARQTGPGYPSGQVSKKAQEAVTLAGIGDFEKAKAEALGLINYGAKLYKLLEEMERAAR